MNIRQIEDRKIREARRIRMECKRAMAMEAAGLLMPEGSIEEFKKLTSEAIPTMKEEARKGVEQRKYVIRMFVQYSDDLKHNMGLDHNDTDSIVQAIINEVTSFLTGYDDSFVVESKDD